MPHQICPRCGAPRTQATSFCTDCGQQFAATTPDEAPVAAGQASDRPARGTLAVVIALMLLLLIGGAIAAAVALGGGDDDGEHEDATGFGEQATFCEIWRDFDRAGAADTATLTEMREIADRMRATGPPADITDEAREGIDVLLRVVDDADSDEAMDENLQSLTPEEQQFVHAAVAYAKETCDGPDSGGATGPGGPGAPNPGVVSEEEFCAGMQRLRKYDEETEFDEGKSHLEAMAEDGSPADFPAGAREGFELYVKWVSTAESPDDFATFQETAPLDEQRKIKEFFAHMEATCFSSSGSTPSDVG